MFRLILESTVPSSRPFAAVALALLLLAAPAIGQDADDGETAAPLTRQLDPELFPVPAELAANVEFWTIVYSRFDSNHVLVHDDRHLQIIYAVLDFSHLEESGMSATRVARERVAGVRRAKEKYTSILRDLALGRTSHEHAEEQKRVAGLFQSVSGGRSRYTQAIDRLRAQTCLRDRFAEGIVRSGYFLGHIERVFAQRGLPIELTRLPLVESLFQWHARSSASAAGIWQFVPGTARLYKLRVGHELDERYDPMQAADAAARFLADNLRHLKTWPLALTAYNHGLYGMKRAVARLGTRDIGTISERYRSRTFGFASRNFYSEFVAAWTVYENREHHFPDVEPAALLAFDEFVAGQYVPVGQLTERTGTDVETLRRMNPALHRDVWKGELHLPKGYPLRVPAGQQEAFAAAYAAVPESLKSNFQAGHRYRVRRGDTLSRIAARYGTSAGAIQRANGLASAHRIRVGQTLRIPSAASGTSRGTSSRRAAATAPSTASSHTVRRGETLTRIAARYGTDVGTLVTLNGLRRADLLRVGQSLRLPGAGRVTHVVRPGETLAAIARRYGTSVAALQHANRIRNHVIHPNQVLVIP